MEPDKGTWIVVTSFKEELGKGGGMVRLTVLHNSGEAIPISQSWWQVAIRTSNVGPLSDEDGLPSSNSITCTKVLRMSSVGR